MKNIFFFPAFLAMTSLQTSCDKDNAPAPNDRDTTRDEWKGIGKSLETPTGTPFYLPDGIELAGNTMKGYHRDKCVCKRDDVSCHRGTGGLVTVCLGFTNTTNEPNTVTIPRGLIIISTDDDVFELGPVTQNSEIQELLNLLKNKRIAEPDGAGVVQAALWNITDGKGLTAYDKQAIAAFVNE